MYGPWRDLRADRSAEEQRRETASADGASRRRINLIAEANGGRLVEAPDASWTATFDGHGEGVFIGAGGDNMNLEVIYRFKDGKRATFDTFEVFVPAAAPDNIKDFELLSSDVLAPESFQSIGRFQVRNVLVFDSPYQAFTFPATTATYLKFRLMSSYHGGYTLLTEFRLLGTIHPE
jgi:hypothetical protein